MLCRRPSTEDFGSISRSASIRLAESASPKYEKPVTLPPGFARLANKSRSSAMGGRPRATIGMRLIANSKRIGRSSARVRSAGGISRLIALRTLRRLSLLLSVARCVPARILAEDGRNRVRGSHPRASSYLLPSAHNSMCAMSRAGLWTASEQVDPPSNWWTPLIRSWGARKVFDGKDEAGLHARVQARGRCSSREQWPATVADRG